MRVSYRSFAWAAAAAVLGPVAAAPAAVSLNITDAPTNLPPSNSEVVTAGSAVSFVLNLVSTGEQVTGMNYFLRVNPAGSGFFRIADRDTTGSSYPAVTFSESEVETQPLSVLNPDNDRDLGGSVANPATGPTGAGTFLVARYSIAVAANTPLGTYTITTFSPANLGYAGPSPNFDDTPFNQHASYQITVVPEPAGLGLAGLAAAGLLARRRTTAAR